jgi:hypothetical protein
MKNSSINNFKKSGIKSTLIEPLSALPLSKKFSGSKENKNGILQ